MLEHYFVRLKTVDGIRASWIGPAIEQYVTWLHEHRYAARVVFSRVPTLVHFGRFASRRGAKTLAELPSHVDAFVDEGAHFIKKKRNTKASRLRVRGDLVPSSGQDDLRVALSENVRGSRTPELPNQCLPSPYRDKGALGGDIQGAARPVVVDARAAFVHSGPSGNDSRVGEQQRPGFRRDGADRLHPASTIHETVASAGRASFSHAGRETLS